MHTPATSPASRIAREVEREREERHKNDDAKAGGASDDDLRVKDARNSSSSGQLHRSGDR